MGFGFEFLGLSFWVSFLRFKHFVLNTHIKVGDFFLAPILKSGFWVWVFGFHFSGLTLGGFDFPGLSFWVSGFGFRV